MNVPFKKKDTYQNIRLSIDTESDLDFFNIIFVVTNNWITYII